MPCEYQVRMCVDTHVQEQLKRPTDRHGTGLSTIALGLFDLCVEHPVAPFTTVRFTPREQCNPEASSARRNPHNSHHRPQALRNDPTRFRRANRTRPTLFKWEATELNSINQRFGSEHHELRGLRNHRAGSPSSPSRFHGSPLPRGFPPPPPLTPRRGERTHARSALRNRPDTAWTFCHKVHDGMFALLI